MILPVALVVQLAGACGPEAAPETLAAIAAAESGFDPLAVYDNTTGTSWRPRSKPAAAALAHRLIGAGHAIDLGLMQITSSNLARLRLAASAAFDPCASLSAGARVLADGYAGGPTHSAQQAALRVALSRYNTGSPAAGFRNGYVARVVAAAKRVVPEIDPAAIAPKPPTAGAAPPVSSWNVFDRSKKLAPPSASARWNIFPQSVGPDRLGDPRPAGAAGSGL